MTNPETVPPAKMPGQILTDEGGRPLTDEGGRPLIEGSPDAVALTEPKKAAKRAKKADEGEA